MKIYLSWILLYEYVTLFDRLKSPTKSVSLSDEAEAFADTIRDLNYETVFLVGHSMGGMLCMAALSYLIKSQQKGVLSRIDGLILMATPQIGSQRVATPMRWFSKDFEALEPHSEIVTDIHKTFVNNRVLLEEDRAQSGDLVVPTWAVLGTSDHWVDKLSASFGIPASRKKTVRGSHTEIVKPPTKTSDAYAYVRDRIKQVFLQRAKIKLVPPSPTPAALTRYSQGRVFISYSRKDGAAFADALREQLIAKELSVWQDIVTLEGGRDWWSQIEETLKSKTLQHFVLVVTPAALASAVAWRGRRGRQYRRSRGQASMISPICRAGSARLTISTFPSIARR